MVNVRCFQASGMSYLIVMFLILNFPMCVYLVRTETFQNNSMDAAANTTTASVGLRQLKREILRLFDLNEEDILTDRSPHFPPPKYARNRLKEFQNIDDSEWPIIIPIENAKPTVWMIRPESVRLGRSIIFPTSSIPTLAYISKVELVFNRVIGRNITLIISTANNPEYNVAHFTEEGYIADVSDLVLNKLPCPSIQLDVRIIGNTSQRINSMRPMLSIFKDIDVEVLRNLNQLRHRRSFMGNNGRSSIMPATAESEDICRVKAWDINFEQIGLSDMVSAPSSYQANYCTGHCPDVFVDGYFNATFHGYLKNMFHVKTNFIYNNVSRACCVPISYRSQSFLLSFNNDTMLMQCPDAVVTACGCR